MTIKITNIPTTLHVAFMGLETMGYPLAGHLARAGHPITVYNRNEGRALQWVEQYGGERAAMPIDTAWEAKMVFVHASDVTELKEIALGKSGAFAGMKPNTIFVNHTSVAKEVTQELAQIAQERFILYMDAPLLGTEEEAINGSLNIMAKSTPLTFERVKPIISAYAQQFTLIDPLDA